MNAHTGETATPDQQVSPAAGIPLRGAWLTVVRGGWIVVVTLYIGLFMVTIPAMYHTQLRDQFLTDPVVQANLLSTGLSPNAYALIQVVLRVVLGIVCCLVAAVIFWRASTEPIALLVALLLVAFGAAPDRQSLEAAGSAWAAPTGYTGLAAFAAVAPFFYLFPNGRFVPRWLVPVWVALLVLFVLFPDPPTLSGVWSTILNTLVIGAWLFVISSFAWAPLYRYWRASNAVERQQTKWLVVGVAVGIIPGVVVGGLQMVFPSIVVPGSRMYVGGQIVASLALLLVPLSIGVAVLRYRLWDIDPIINRTLVYVALTVCVIGIYVLVVGYLGTVLNAQGNFLISLIATGIVAVIFQPLRERLQRGVNRLMYGERDEPYTVISRLGQRLEATLAPDAVLPTIVETVKEALKLPYVAIALKHEEGFAIAAEYGRPQGSPLHDDLVRLPLVYQRETVVQLFLEPRAPGETFGPADRRLLDDLARQAGVTAHAVRLHTQAVQLAADLQRSRERLVSAREEERRRLRRDLHDGLGPRLASQTMKLEAARDLLAVDPARADALLDDLIEQSQTAIADIRRLVYALRPPALDELGLVSAIREQTAQYGGEHTGSPLRVVVDAPGQLPPLPAAVEVAVYRIVQEALTNVVRHAGAQQCVIRLRLDDAALWLEIEDDGIGLPVEHHAGVGLNSMRERAEELGGTCVIETAAMGGTTVRSRLPLHF